MQDPPPPAWQRILPLLFALRRRPRAVLALLLCAQLLHGTYGLNQDLVWGHAAFHMAEYGTQAVHLRRHGAFIPAESDEFRPPRRDELELRHPFLLHPYIAVFQGLFGERPWTARIVPLLFSLLAVGGMWSLVRRTRDALTAHLSTALFVLSPLNLSFSHLPEYQISAIAWTLWSFVGLHETLRRPTAKSVSLWLVGTALAGLTDWPWFEIAFFLAFPVAWRLRPGGPIARASAPRELRVMRAAFVGFCLVVLATFAQHFAIVKHLGQLDALRQSFNERRGGFPWPEYRALLEARLPLLHTTPVLAATALWVARAVLTWRRDLATALFLSLFLGMVLDLKNFPGAFAFHEYRDAYWFVPVFAFATADVVLGAARWLAERFRSLREAVLVPVAAALLATAALGKEAPEMLRLSRARGGSVSMVSHDPHVAEFTMARVTHHLGRGRKIFLGAGMAAGCEFHWLLEAPYVDLTSILQLQSAMERREPFVAVDRIDTLRAYPEWAAIARQSQVFLFDRSAALVWTPDTAPTLETARLSFVPRGRLDAWLHAEPTEPVIVAGSTADALSVANDISAPPEVLEKIQRGERPLLRRIPAHARSRGTR